MATVKELAKIFNALTDAGFGGDLVWDKENTGYAIEDIKIIDEKVHAIFAEYEDEDAAHDCDVYDGPGPLEVYKERMEERE